MKNKVIDTTLKPLYGHPCWGLRYCRQLNLSMKFGKPALNIREPFSTDSRFEAVQRIAAQRRVTVRGEWWLWIWCCYWRLTAGGLELASGSSSLQRIKKALTRLEGQALLSVEVKPETGATRFAFDLGCALDLRRFRRGTDDELWMLHKPSGYVLSVRGNGTFSHQRGGNAENRPQPIDDVAAR